MWNLKQAMCFVKNLTVTIVVVSPVENKNPPASQARFLQFRVMERFRIDGSNKRSDDGHSNKD